MTNANLYRQLYEATTKNLPRDCQFNQSITKEKQPKGKSSIKQEKQPKGKSSECLKGNQFASLAASDSDEEC